MRYMFNAQTAEDEKTIKQMVDRTITALRTLGEGQSTVILQLDEGSAMVIVKMIEIGVAPGYAPIAAEFRKQAHCYRRVSLQMTKEFAYSLSHHIETGLMRHGAGCDRPDQWVLH